MHTAVCSGNLQLAHKHPALCRWNFTRSPGWTKDEKDMLILLLQVYGIGNWRAIIESDMLPGKRITQMNGQTQRLVGQQSLAGMARIQLVIQAEPPSEMY